MANNYVRTRGIMRNSLTKYYFGFGLLAVGLLALVGIVLVQASATKADKNTYKAATKIADKLDAYVTKNYRIPSSLSAANIVDVPNTVTYHKLSDRTYKFCVSYRAKSSGFDPQAAAFGVLTGVSAGTDYDDTSTDDSAYIYVPTTHRKGTSCQTVTPYLPSRQVTVAPFTKDTDGGYTVCGVKTTYYEGDGHVSTSLTADSTYVQATATTSPYTGASLLFMISTDSKFFDEQCRSISPATIQQGDTLSTFDITSPSAPAVSIFLKRSY